MSDVWVPSPHNTEGSMVEHLNGVPWFEAPIPKVLFHWHRPQTRGWYGTEEVHRCACGAIRSNGSIWRRRERW